jgi:cell division protein FtsA
MVEVADPSVGIDDRDCRKAMDRALKFNMPPDVEILHHVVREFIVNGERQIVNPRGLFGGQLEVRAHVITGAISAGNNLSRCVKKAGLKTTSIVLESLASALSTLGDRERELGVVLIDIGGGTTDIAVFGEGSLQYIAEIASGGDTLTHDVQTVLRCAPQDAEHLKKKFGHANPLAVDPEERIDLRGPAKGGGCVQYPRRELARILEARVEEILFAVKKVIQRSGFANRIYGGAVLTGGTALLEGIAAVAERILDQPTRIGMPRGLRGMGELVSSPIYSTGVGLIHWAAEEGPGYRPDPWLIRKFKEVFDLYG